MMLLEAVCQKEEWNLGDHCDSSYFSTNSTVARTCIELKNESHPVDCLTRLSHPVVAHQALDLTFSECRRSYSGSAGPGT